jgi:hypothetical protein
LEKTRRVDIVWRGEELFDLFLVVVVDSLEIKANF